MEDDVRRDENNKAVKDETKREREDEEKKKPLWKKIQW
jgi:hypothetical protein